MKTSLSESLQRQRLKRQRDNGEQGPRGSLCFTRQLLFPHGVVWMRSAQLRLHSAVPGPSEEVADGSRHNYHYCAGIDKASPHLIQLPPH